eukprot:s996_g25.t1
MNSSPTRASPILFFKSLEYQSDGDQQANMGRIRAGRRRCLGAALLGLGIGVSCQRSFVVPKVSTSPMQGRDVFLSSVAGMSSWFGIPAQAQAISHQATLTEYCDVNNLITTASEALRVSVNFDEVRRSFCQEDQALTMQDASTLRRRRADLHLPCSIAAVCLIIGNEVLLAALPLLRSTSSTTYIPSPIVLQSALTADDRLGCWSDGPTAEPEARTEQRGTCGAGLSGGGLGHPWSPSALRLFCVAGMVAVGAASVLRGDIYLPFVWQAWPLVTSTSLSCGRRGTYGAGLAPVAVLVTLGRRGRRTSFAWQALHLVTSAFLLCGALGDIHVTFAWQAWHLRRWAGSGGGLGRPCSPWAPRLFCMAGVALGDTCLPFTWQIWRFVALAALGWLWFHTSTHRRKFRNETSDNMDS